MRSSAVARAARESARRGRAPRRRGTVRGRRGSRAIGWAGGRVRGHAVRPPWGWGSVVGVQWAGVASRRGRARRGSARRVRRRRRAPRSGRARRAAARRAGGAQRRDVRQRELGVRPGRRVCRRRAAPRRGRAGGAARRVSSRGADAAGTRSAPPAAPGALAARSRARASRVARRARARSRASPWPAPAAARRRRRAGPRGAGAASAHNAAAPPVGQPGGRCSACASYSSIALPTSRVERRGDGAGRRGAGLARPWPARSGARPTPHATARAGTPGPPATP